MVVWMMATLSASVLTPGLAQEVTTVVDDRVQSDVAELPAAAPASRRDGWDLDAVISAAYDSNILLSPSRPEADLVSELGVSMAYAHGDPDEGEGGFLRFAYRPTAVLYADHGSASRIDQQAALSAAWRGKATKISYTGLVRQLGGATADTGRQVDRMESENELRAAWSPREKITLEAAVGHRRTDYDDPAFFDSNEAYGEAALRYAYSPKTKLGAAYRAGRFKVDGAEAQTTHQVSGSIDWQPREKIRLGLQAGAEQRRTENGSGINPVAEGRLEWTPREGTSLYFTGYRREEASAFFAGQNYNLKGATAGISQRLGEKWTARLEGGHESATYSRVAGAGTSGRKDTIWFVRPALDYRITDIMDISLFYRLSENRSTDPAFGYDQRLAGIEIKYQF